MPERINRGRNAPDPLISAVSTKAVFGSSPVIVMSLLISRSIVLLSVYVEKVLLKAMVSGPGLALALAIA